MSRVTPYVKTTWEDRPATTSKINSVNLNHIETGLKNVTDAVNEIPETPELEPATTSKLGGIKVGSRLSITNDGTLSAWDQSYTLPTASANTKGGIKVGSRLSIDNNGVLSADEQTGSSSLRDLSDVVISSPTEGQILKYDSVFSKWINGTGGGGGASDLDDLGDVVISSPLNSQILKYDSTTSKWVNGDITELTYAETMEVLNGSYTKTNVYLTDQTASSSPAPFSQTPAVFSVDGQTGRFTFNNTGIANVQEWFIGIYADLNITIPIGSLIVLDGNAEDIFLKYHGDRLTMTDGVVTVTEQLLSHDINILMSVVNGKEYALSFVLQVWIPQ